MEVVSILGDKGGKMMKLEETELRLGLPGMISIINANGKRGLLSSHHHHHVPMEYLKLNLASNSKQTVNDHFEMNKKNLVAESNDPIIKPPPAK